MAIEIKTLNGDSPLNETVKKSHNLINFPIKNSIFTIRLRRTLRTQSFKTLRVLCERLIFFHCTDGLEQLYFYFIFTIISE